MKNLSLLFCLFFISVTVVNAQRTYVPDDNFEQALINNGLDNVLDNYVLTANISGITNLDVQNSRFGIDGFGIIDLTGIEDFTSLEYLDCSYNNIIYLDLSSNPSLEVLFCNVNDLTSLNVTSNTALKTLNCDSNELPQLNVSNNASLEFLYCVTNKLTSINVSSNPVLVRLRCSVNDLTYLNVKNGNNSNFHGDVVLGFEAYSNPNLNCIQVDNVAYSNASWSHKDPHSTYSTSCIGVFTILPDIAFELALIDLGYDDILDGYVLTKNIVEIIKLDVTNKKISDLTGIEDFSALETLYCQNNKLTNIDFSNNKSLTFLNCSDNQLEALNLNNKNNINFNFLNTTGNENLLCIQVDRADYSNQNWKSNYFNKDKHSKFSEKCEVLSTNEIVKTSFQIYPNPVKNELNIKLENGIKLKQVNIYNAFGQLVSTSKKLKINTTNLSSGFYFIEVETNQGKSAKKIVVE